MLGEPEVRSARVRRGGVLAAAASALAGASAASSVGFALADALGADGELDRAAASSGLVLMAALGVLAVGDADRAARSALPIGAVLAATGLAIGWLGHTGWPLVGAAGVLVLPAVLRLVAVAPRRRRAPLALLAATAGSALLLAAVGGVLTQLLDAVLRHGYDCLEGFAGDPGGYPSAPATPDGIRTGFAWVPLGRVCTWTLGHRTVVDHQGDAATGTEILGTGVVGAALLLLLAVLRLARR